MYDIQKLQKHRRKPTGLVGLSLITPVRKSVPEWQPLLLNKSLEAINGPVVGVEEYLSHRDHLGGDVPPILQTDHDRGALDVEQINCGTC